MYNHSMDMEAILRKAIHESDRTQYRIAKDAGISLAQMSYFINGHRSLSLNAAGKLAETLGFEMVQKKRNRKAR